MDAATVENFFGVYLLFCENPAYRGRTYIGYTIDPNRRIDQHNKGRHAGGAMRTSNRGPWAMVLIIHGFPNEISALRFEWAWQHPERSRRLRDAVAKKKTKENRFDFSLRVLSHMLSTGPWCRLALTIQWLKPAYAVDFDPSMLPPPHMPIQYGPVVPKKATPQSELAETSYGCCTLCKKQLSAADRLTCINSGCSMESHIICLATNFLKSEPAEIVPLEGQCPKCKQSYLWADLIRKLQGCYQQDPSDN